RVGLHTSPHLFHVSERMRVDGVPAPGDWLASAICRVHAAAETIEPSYFEFTLALSLLYFAERRVDMAVVEVGMGGRLDATNVLAPVASVITHIGLDHTEFLGSTIEGIAREKAGIIKSDTPVVTSAVGRAANVIRRRSEQVGTTLFLVDDEIDVRERIVAIRGSTIDMTTPLRSYADVFVGLPGRHQIRNAATAVRTAEVVLGEVADAPAPILEGLMHVRRRSGLWGRIEVMREAPLVVADVAHNADGLAVALDHLKQCHRLQGRLSVLLGVMKDKDAEAMGRLLRDVDARVRPVFVPSERALSPAELAALLEVVGVNVGEPCSVSRGLDAFLSDATHSDTLLVTGSHLVVSELGSSAI
ncbi:MAG: Mur ligase family protein, partial [Rhodothermales bacterium]